MSSNPPVELSPNKWKIWFEGCRYSAIMTDYELHNPVETRMGSSGIQEPGFLCKSYSEDNLDFAQALYIKLLKHRN
jgi:hypothetical protein